MACIRSRRGRWVLDYRDATGVRRWLTFRTRREAEDAFAEALPASRQRIFPAVDPAITFAVYAQRWLEIVQPTLKPSTIVNYRQRLDRHILPVFGSLPIRRVQRGAIKALLAEKVRSGLSPDSVRLIHATIRVILNAAIDDEVIQSNPADRLGRVMRLGRSRARRQEEIKAFDRTQLQRLLGTAEQADAKLHPLVLTLARTGMRLGEALALEWDDIDFARREIRIARAISGGRIDTPKSGHGRTVDMSAQLAETLLALRSARQAKDLRSGTPVQWAFPSEARTPLEHHNVAKRFKRILRAAGLPGHFHLHCLRHTFASLLLQQGESPAYVQRQLGHASYQLTVDTYGRWLPMGNKAAVDRLDDAKPACAAVASGSNPPKVVAEKGSTATPRDLLQPVVGKRVRDGDPPWTRTMNPEIKSLLLYQLS